MSEIAFPTSFWRCDADGESFAVSLGVASAREAETGLAVDVPPDIDLVIETVPCPICGSPMRRTVSLLDFRDWSAQVA